MAIRAGAPGGAGLSAFVFQQTINHTSALLHLHAMLMLVWLAMALIQPLLVVYKKVKLHRIIGKLSYFIIPLLLASGWLVIQRSYAGMIVPASGELPDPDQITAANQTIFIPVLFLGWLGLFYVLAVVYRKQVVAHATFMLAAVLTLIGPSFDRLLFQIYKVFAIEFNWFAEYATFILIDLILLLVLYKQWRSKYSLKWSLLTIGIYVAGQIGSEILPGSQVWNWFVETTL